MHALDDGEQDHLAPSGHVPLHQGDAVERESHSMGIRCSRMPRRLRPTSLAVIVACCYYGSGVRALSSSASASTSPYASLMAASPAHSPSSRDAPPHSWTDSVLLQDDKEGDDDEQDDWEEELMDFQQLQRSTGSDVLNAELQLQIDQSMEQPDLFLDSFMEGDASSLEKVAMSSIPEQLPRSAVKALTNQKDKKKKKRSSIRELNFAQNRRVTPKQELHLAQLIQKGVALHKLKTDLEVKHGREISRTEWTQAADMTPKELRQTVLEYRRAKQLLVSANMGLVHAVVQSQRQSLKNGITYEEMVQEGSLGLLRAAELFDPSRGLRFSTYATIWIKGVLRNSHVLEPITLPQREKTKWNKIRKAQEEFQLEFDREPTLSELSERLDHMSLEELVTTQRKMTRAQHVLSLDYEYQTSSRSGNDSSTMATLQNNDKAFMADADLFERTQLHADVVAALARNLDPREARLMRLRYGLTDGQTRTIQQCAEAMGLSQTRTQQIAQACLKKLRQAKEMKSLDVYFLTIA